MEHAKKLMLVEPRFYSPPTIGQKTLNGLDDEIRQTLDANAPDDQKIKLYRMTLRKYMSYTDNVARVEEAKAEEKKKALDEKDVLDSIAINDRHKAKRLLNYLKRSDEARLDHNDELTYQQRRLAGSNIVDLIDNALSKTATDRPEGWDEFINILKDVKAPRALIANKNLLREAFPAPAPPVRAARQRFKEALT